MLELCLLHQWWMCEQCTWEVQVVDRPWNLRSSSKHLHASYLFPLWEEQKHPELWSLPSFLYLRGPWTAIIWKSLNIQGTPIQNIRLEYYHPGKREISNNFVSFWPSIKESPCIIPGKMERSRKSSKNNVALLNFKGTLILRVNL